MYGMQLKNKIRVKDCTVSEMATGGEGGYINSLYKSFVYYFN